MSQPPPQPMIPQTQLMAGEDSSGYFPDPAEVAAGMPINLDSLRDGPPGSKPFYPYSTLIRYAIKGSPHQKLLLEDIYYAIESRFPYFRTAANGWKNSVRHNLSLSPCFEKMPRPLTDRGKGSYWIVNDNVDPRTGVHRVRNKKKVGRPRKNGEEHDDEDYAEGGEGATQGQDADYSTQPGPSSETNPSEAAQHVAAQQAQQQQVEHQAQQAQQRVQQQPPPGYPPNFLPPHPPFDPQHQNFMMPGIQFAHPPPHMGGIHMGEDVELTETGEINWRVAWLKELGHLQAITQLQDKANVDPAWYHMMLYRLRHALLTPMDINGQLMPPPGGIVMPPPPPPQQQPPAASQ